MKILAIEHDVPGVPDSAFTKTILEHEARTVWRLNQQNAIREIYFDRPKGRAMLVLECRNLAAARRILNKLPLVRKNLIEFDLLEMGPYPGFGRLFRAATE